MKKNIFVILFFTISGAFAQNAKLDSLQSVLQTAKDDTAKVNLLNSIAVELGPAKAANYVDRALQLAQKLNWQKGIGNAYVRKAVIERTQGNYTQALAYYKDALTHFVKDNYKAGQALSYNGTGNVYMGLSDYPRALEYYSKGLKISEAINDKKSIANSLKNLSRVYNCLSDYTKTLENLSKSEKIMQELHDKSGLASVYIGMGIVYYGLSDYPKSLEYYLKGLKLYEELGEKNGMASSLENIGLVYNQLGDLSRALEYLLKAQKIFESINGKEQISHLLGNIGAVYLGLGKFSEALSYFSKDLQMAEESGNKRVAGYSLNGIGSVYISKKQFAKAIECQEKALKIFNGIDDKSGIGSALKNIAEAHLGSRQYNEAIKDISKALVILKEIKSIGEEGNANLLLSECYEKIGKPELALTAYKKYINLRDSVVNIEKSKEITRKQMQYDFDKREALQQAEQGRKDAISQAESSKQRLIRNSFIAGFLMVVVLAGSIYRNYRQKQQINTELEKKNLLVELQNKEITDSITYARRIQHAILPATEDIYKTLPNAFILNKPKDVVSGDFYAFDEKNGQVILAAIDCTGHGVPGAFMSVIGHNLLTEIVVEHGITKPSLILEELNKSVRKALKQDTNTTRDGMDAVIVSIDLANKKLQYAGANRPLWIISGMQLSTINGDKNASNDNSLTTVAPTKSAIGGHTEVSQAFENHEIALQQGDSIYLFTDGFVDQFGGAEGKKLMTKRFKEILINIQSLSMQEQEIALNKAFEEWKGTYEQVDDVLVIGVRV